MIGGDQEMADPSEYDESMPRVQGDLEGFERAIASVRRTHSGFAIEEVRQALLVALDAEGLTVWNEVVDDAARHIAGRELE